VAGRFSRFLNLERGRPARGSEAEPSGRGRTARFDALEPSAAAPTDVRPAKGHLARFDAPAEEELRVYEQREADPPFVRCVRCEVDSGRFARSCAACGEDLDTPEQRSFNERVWKESQAQRSADQAQDRAREEARREEITQAAEQNRAYYEELARRVGRETRQRIDEDAWDWRLARWRGAPLRLTGRHFGIIGVVSTLIALAALAMGSKWVVRALAFIAVGVAFAVVRWLRRR
jgi:hypothetical protein